MAPAEATEENKSSLGLFEEFFNFGNYGTNVSRSKFADDKADKINPLIPLSM